jgi:hypothetical protein
VAALSTSETTTALLRSLGDALAVVGKAKAELSEFYAHSRKAMDGEASLFAALDAARIRADAIRETLERHRSSIALVSRDP